MRLILALFLVLSFSAHADYRDFSVSKECRKSIQTGLSRQDFALTKILSATMYPGGSDGASSWDTEYVVHARVRDRAGHSLKVLVYVEDAYSCKVQNVVKAAY